MADVRRWRVYGGLPVVLCGPEAIVDRAAAFFGPAPWTLGAPSSPQVMKVTLGAAGDDVSCAGDELLAGDFVGDPNKVFAELEARVLIAALARLPRAALHAAVVAWDDRTWLLAAEHAVGKTTTALAIGLAATGRHGGGRRRGHP
jgi:hypothetical protein